MKVKLKVRYSNADKAVEVVFGVKDGTELSYKSLCFALFFDRGALAELKSQVKSLKSISGVQQLEARDLVFEVEFISGERVLVSKSVEE